MIRGSVRRRVDVCIVGRLGVQLKPADEVLGRWFWLGEDNTGKA